MKRNVTAVLLALVLSCLTALPVGASGGWTWERLVSFYGERESMSADAVRLSEDLIGGAPFEDPRLLWASLWGDLPTRDRASRALALVKALYPSGDPSRWEEISGFWRPQEIPLSLAALDAVYVAAISLVELEDPGAVFLAESLLRSLSRSSRARYFAMLTAPEEYVYLTSSLNMGSPWPMGRIEGRLPFAHPVRGRIGESAAVTRGMTFLDGLGGVASGGGRYAWDRSGGRIYRVVRDDDSAIWVVD